MPSSKRGLVLLGWILCASAAWCAPLDVQQGEHLNANAALQLCITPPSAQWAEVVSATACQNSAETGTPAPLNVARGVDARHAFWVQLTLSNSGASPAERWLQVGHPRLEEVSLYLPDGHRLDAGLNTPMLAREEVPRHYGVLPVVLPAHSTQTVWVRVYTRTLVDLGVAVWSPNAYRESMGLNMMSLHLALGALIAALVYATGLFVQTGELPYVFFAVAMAGEIALESFRAGILQRYGWPGHWPMPIQWGPLASLVSLSGFVAFFYTLVPQARKQRRVFPVYIALVIATLAAQLWSILVNYEDAVLLWSQGLYVVLLLGIWIIWQAWRSGFRPAGALLLGFSLMAIPETLRQASTFGWLPFLRVELLSGPWALVFLVPVLFVGMAQRSRELQARLIQADSENQAKIEFLAQMSHELRTPLDTILGNAQLLSRPANQALLQEGLGHILHSGRHLLTMIDQVLDYSRGIAGKLHIRPEPVNWMAFTKSLQQTGGVLALQRGNTFTFSSIGISTQALVFDEHRLQQVLDNLVANAARHTSNGWIHVDCSLHGEQLHFCVSDSGEGIAQQDLSRIFLPFERGTQAGKGVGMGLAISRQLVQSMGGELTVKSALGKGAAFSFWVHVRPAAHVAPHVEPVTHASFERRYRGRTRTVLVVDDNAESLAILQTLLLNCGLEAVLASSAKQAVQMLRDRNTVDLVIADQRMEDGDGWMVLEAACKRNTPVPAILISAEPSKRPEGLDARCQFDFEMLKPLDHALLLQHVASAIGLQWDADFLVANPHAPATPPPKPPEYLHPPAPKLESLRAFVASGQVSEILQWASALQAAEPQYTRFAQEVSVAARYLDFPALEVLVNSQDTI